MDSPARTLALRRWAVHPPVARELACQLCGVTFTAHAPTAKFCSTNCRIKAWQRAKRAAS